MNFNILTIYEYSIFSHSPDLRFVQIRHPMRSRTAADPPGTRRIGKRFRQKRKLCSQFPGNGSDNESKTGVALGRLGIALPAVASFGIFPGPDPTVIFALSEGEIVVAAVVAGPTIGTGVPAPNPVLIAVGLMLFAIGALKATTHSIPSRFNFL